MKTLRFRRWCLASVLAAGLLQCNKQDAAAQSVTATAALQPSLVEAASKFGFAAKLPATMEFYIGSSELKTHFAELKKSAFWKDVEALFNDKIPAPSASDKSLGALQKLWGDDFFIAGAAGFSESALALRDLNRLSSEMNFRSLMAGTTGKPSQNSKAGPLKMLDTLLKDPDLLRRAEALAGKFEAPPLIIGIKAENPAELLKQLIPEAMLKSTVEMGTVSDLTTPEGFAFKVIAFDGHKILSDKDRADFVTNLPADTKLDVRQLADKFLTDVQSKKVSVAYGVAGDHIIFACGKNLDHLKFVPDAAQSLLSKPALAALAPYTSKDLLGLVYAEAGVVNALSDDQPVTPMARGVVSAMKDSDMFRELAEKLSSQVEELSALESKIYKRECTTLVAAAWWEKGLHAELFGGARPRFFRSGMPLQFAQLLEKPGVLFGMAFNRDKDYEKESRAWMEKLTGMIFTTAQELVQAGIAGKDGAQQFAMFDTNIRPILEKLYQADKNLAEKGLGGQCAYIVDMKGKLPGVPGLPPAMKSTVMPRLFSINEVNDRAQVTQSWTAMSEAILKSAEGSPLAAFALPEPMSSDKNGVTTWFYALPFFNGDTLPCASANDKLLILGSSKDGAEAMAGDLAKATPSTTQGCVWKLDFALISELIKSYTKLSAKDAKGTDEIKQTMKWLKPFHTLQSHTFEEDGRLRGSISWEITDVLKFD